jgi:hydrogenase expression/formation protein HypE
VTDLRAADVQEEVLERLERMRKRRPRFTDERVTMAHGAGGKATRQLVEGLFVPLLENPALSELSDAGIVGLGGVRVAFTTDSFVVHPISFPGGSIGELCVNGTINDLAVAGAQPVALSVALVLEEGLAADVVRAEAEAIARAAKQAGVAVVAGDTKVVERGKADALYATTAGIGLLHDVDLSTRHVRPGDKILVSGTIGDHGTAIMIARGELDLDADVRSDTQPLHALSAAVVEACGGSLRCMRDPTRGGVATVLNEIAMSADTGVVVDEEAVPVRPEVSGACEILGIDPLYVANEGKLLAVVAPQAADAALAAMRDRPEGSDAAVIGEVTDEPAGRVLGKTGFGGHRMIDVLVGDPLPRIC